MKFKVCMGKFNIFYKVLISGAVVLFLVIALLTLFVDWVKRKFFDK